MSYLTWHLLRDSARRVPEKEAVVYEDQRLSYRQLDRMVQGLATGLRRAGLQRGDRVGTYLEKSIPQVISIFGISQSEGVYVPINALLRPKQLMHIARDCGIKALITTAAKLPMLSGVLSEIPSLEFLVLEGKEESCPMDLPVFGYEDLCALDPDIRREMSIGKDLAAILYTSGSTGKPKGVMLSHANIMTGSRIVSDYLGITENDRILAVLPFSFDAGLNQLMTAFEKGATLVMLNFVFAREIVEILRKETITGLAGVPTLWRLLAESTSSLAEQPLPELRYITNTGGAMPLTVLKALRRALPSTRVFLMYGLTEAFRSTYLPPEEVDRRPGSIGKAIPDTEVLILNEHGRACGPGEIGELVHRGPTVSMGYWDRPEDTARTLRRHPLLPPEMADCEKVCYSGDLVKMDEDGFLYFVGRRDALIKSSGVRISPTEIEEALIETGDLREAAVIGIPDDVLGHAIKAFVTPLQGETLDTKALLAKCAKHIPTYMMPKTVDVLDELPKTTSGKVDYHALRDPEKSLARLDLAY
jgi:acyl-CoA ligase (AMP-forming) (exosortase A-associated)